MYGQICLVPAISKKLIATAITKLPVFGEALRNGTVIVSPSTTTLFLYSAITGSPPDSAIACGITTPKGACMGREMASFVEGSGHARTWIFEKGFLKNDVTLEEVLPDLTKGDLFIKGGNAIDQDGKVGIYLGLENGGTVGVSIGYLLGKGIEVIIPVGLEKMIRGSVFDIAGRTGVQKVDRSMGMPVGFMNLPGEAITEIEALKVLFSVEAKHMGSGGVLGAEGAVMLSLEGSDDNISKVFQFIEKTELDELDYHAILHYSNCREHRMPSCIRKNYFYKSNIKQNK